MRQEALENNGSKFIGWKPRIVILSVILIGLATFVYADALATTFHLLVIRKDASHGLLVPFIMGYLIWVRRKRIADLKLVCEFLPGILIIVPGLCLIFLDDGGKE